MRVIEDMDIGFYGISSVLIDNVFFIMGGDVRVWYIRIWLFVVLLGFKIYYVLIIEN